MSREEWRAVLSVNLDGVWFTAQEAARRLVAADRPGAIINIASLLGFRVQTRLAAYAVAKAGVVQMTEALALELARHKHPGQRHRARLHPHRDDRAVLFVATLAKP